MEIATIPSTPGLPYLVIGLSRGKRALISESDRALITPFKWSVARTHAGNYYAVRNIYTRDAATQKVVGTQVLMHRVILGATKGQRTKHLNGDGLDNRRENLSIVTEFNEGMDEARPLPGQDKIPRRRWAINHPFVEVGVEGMVWMNYDNPSRLPANYYYIDYEGGKAIFRTGGRTMKQAVAKYVEVHWGRALKFGEQDAVIRLSRKPKEELERICANIDRRFLPNVDGSPILPVDPASVVGELL